MARDLLAATVMAALRLSRVNLLLLAVMMTGIGLAVLRPQELVLYNPSESLPKGFYVQTEGELTLGAIVTIRSVDAAPEYAARRNFTDTGDRFLKRIAAVEGDTVCADVSLIRINDVQVAERAETDPAGDPLPSWNGCVTLAGGEVFLLGDHPGSFDGRYWGLSQRADLTGPWRRVR
ncbi:MAG: S26 family signal peptidase [Alphaproteobacteria bacterium HGW-Alphaproteobacteria-18]|nr:MAG: S26 family signal peptidase [Alphaproteobacteria bacterium HGW-Alphaproteobacteria-18]